MKRCSRCKEEKQEDEFYKSKSCHDGLHPQCKACKRVSDHRAYLKNAEKRKEAQRARYKKTAEDQRVKARERYARRVSTPEGRAALRERQRDWLRKRRENDPAFRMERSFSREVSRGINKGYRSWEKLVDYDLDDLCKHLELQFRDGMTWENYGTFWHIDHIMPRSSFRFTCASDEGFQACWALSNLRPLKAADNLSKGNRVDFLL